MVAASNNRYLEFISAIDDDTIGHKKLEKATETKTVEERNYKGLNTPYFYIAATKAPRHKVSQSFSWRFLPSLWHSILNYPGKFKTPFFQFNNFKIFNHGF